MNSNARLIIDKKLEELSHSKFRTSFHLRNREISYLDKVGMDKVLEHAYEFVRKNLAPSYIENDGKQTPMKNHPVFIAQHATATCCRGCLEKWHHIKKGKELSENEINYIVFLIMEWIKRNYK